MKVGTAALVVCVAILGSGAAGATSPPDDELTPEQLDGLERSFVDVAAEDDYAISAAACTVDDGDATCYGRSANAVVVGSGAWDERPPPSWALTEFMDAALAATTTSTAAPTTTVSPTTTLPSVPPEYLNALRSAEQYLEFTAFSRPGLIGQLEYEQFSTEAAQWAVDRVAVDWNEQAALSAGTYLDYTAFSEGGLRDQLEYEGFTSGEIDFAISAMVAQGRL